jgi:hypothetical protein
MIEVLKQALEALEDVGVLTDREWQAVHKNKANELRQAIAELESQEPVAWISKHNVVYPLDAKHEVHPINELKPLYTHPPQRTEPVCPECKAEVLYECVACSRNNYPPQRTESVAEDSLVAQKRTWVGLTDDDDIDWEEGGNLKDLVKAIEAKLKQKNGFTEENT